MASVIGRHRDIQILHGRRCRASNPATIGNGSAAMMRQSTKSDPKNGNSHTSARVYPISVQLTMKATTAPASAPITRKAPATG